MPASFADQFELPEWACFFMRDKKESDAVREWMAVQKGRLLHDEARVVIADLIAWQPRSKGK